MTARASRHRHRHPRSSAVPIGAFVGLFVSVFIGVLASRAGTAIAAPGPPLPGPAPIAAFAVDDAMAAASRYAARTRWGIFRKGDRIGTHTVRFTRDGDDLLVGVNSRIRVTLLRIPVFRFDYEATERWRDGRLESVDAEVRENGRSRRHRLRSNGDESRLSGPDGDARVPRLAFATNHWHPGVLGSERVFNTLTGAVNGVRIEAVGTGALAAAEGAVRLPYTRYRYRGDVELEAWYDGAGRWVGLAFDGEDGSRIEYRLEPAFR